MEINKNLRSLRKRSEQVLEIGDEIGSLVSEMIETMDANEGIGLAAPQVGVMKRVVVIKVDGNDIPLVNPVLVRKGREKDVLEEGCLSLPDRIMEIRRPVKVEATAFDLDGNEIDLELEGLPARIFQHELDHLDGKLILDRVSLIRKIKNLFVK